MESARINTEVAEAIIGVARHKGYLREVMTVIPELADLETELMVMVSTRLGEYVRIKQRGELDQEELHSLFVFVLAKAAEAVCCWRCRSEFNMDGRGMFDGVIPLQSDPDLMKSLRNLPLADDMYDAFSQWAADNHARCQQHAIHPLLPLLEALKWTFRVSVGLIAEYFEKHSGAESAR